MAHGFLIGVEPKIPDCFLTQSQRNAHPFASFVGGETLVELLVRNSCCAREQNCHFAEIIEITREAELFALLIEHRKNGTVSLIVRPAGVDLGFFLEYRGSIDAHMTSQSTEPKGPTQTLDEPPRPEVAHSRCTRRLPPFVFGVCAFGYGALALSQVFARALVRCNPRCPIFERRPVDHKSDNRITFRCSMNPLCWVVTPP